MTRDRFWALVEQASGDEAALEEALAALHPAEIAAFQAHLDELFAHAYRWDLWGAASLMEGGCSDDAFVDFRYGLVALGRRRYEAALGDPDSLCEVDDPVPNEGFGYAALKAYEAATGEEPERRTAHPEEPSGEEWDLDDEEEARRRLPRLARRYLAG